MIGWSKMNEILRDMIPNGMLLDVTVSPMEKKRYNNHLILTRLFSTNTLASVEKIYSFYCLINNKI